MNIYTMIGLLLIPLCSTASMLRYHTLAISIACISVTLGLVGVIEEIS